MASSLVRAAVDEVLEDWDSDAVPVRLPNTGYQPPAPGPWVMIEFPGSAVDRADIGAPAAPTLDEVGALMVHVMVPKGAGDAAAAAIGDALWELFLHAGDAGNGEVDGVRFDARLAGISGDRTIPGVEGAWWGMSYGIAFRLLAVSVV